MTDQRDIDGLIAAARDLLGLDGLLVTGDRWLDGPWTAYDREHLLTPPNPRDPSGLCAVDWSTIGPALAMMSVNLVCEGHHNCEAWDPLSGEMIASGPNPLVTGLRALFALVQDGRFPRRWPKEPA